MARCLLGMDYGTGGAKTCIIDEEGNVLSYAFREYPIIIEKPGWSEHNPKLYWEYACEMIQECITKAGINPHDIKGIGNSSALPSMVLVDKNHEPINMAYNLMDRRATKEVQWVKEEIGEEKTFKITGNRLDDHPLIVNLLWERNNRPESFARIHKVLTIDGYIRLRLTGKATMHYSAGPYYGAAYDLKKNAFVDEALAQLHMDPALFPEIFPCDAVIGEVTPQAAAETGLVPGIPVAGGQVDCNAGWVGAGAINEGDIQMNFGTVGNFGIILKDTDFIFSEVGYSMINFAYTVNSHNTFITVPTTTTGGQLIRYIREKFSQVEVEMERITGVDSYDLLNLEAQKIPIGCEGLIILPYLMGERTPIWDVNARGVIFGLSLNHGKGHLVRGMMEAAAYALYDSYRLIKEAGVKINPPIVLNEGGAKSKLWRRIITDVFDTPTVLVKNRIGAPYGDAILAGVATGVFKDYSIAKEKTQYIERMEPISAHHKQYKDYFALYKKIYAHLREDFTELAKLREEYL